MIELRDKFTDELIESHELEVGLPLNEWLAQHIDDFEARDCPPISIEINGVLTVQKGWTRVIRKGDVIVIVSEPKAAVGIFIIKALVGAAISYAVTALTAPDIPDNYNATAPTGSSIYSANGQGNTPKLNGVIPQQFGLHKYFPDNLSQPWRRYENNEQFLYMALCCGVGEFEVESINIGNTAIVAGVSGAMYDTSGSFNYTDPNGNYELEYHAPGETISGSGNIESWRNIYASREVGSSGTGAGFDLKAPTFGGVTVGPFNATPANEKVNRLYVDILFTNGLGKVENTGQISSVTVKLKVLWREIGAWAWNITTLIYTENTVDQIGITEEIVLTAGTVGINVEVKMHRETVESTDSSVRDSVQWTALKAELAGESSYDDVSVLLLKIKGTNLASSASNRINVVQRRKLGNFDDTANAWLPYTGPIGLSMTTSTLPAGVVVPSSARLAALHVMVDAGLNVETDIDFEGLALLNDYEFNAVFDEASTLFPVLTRIAAVAYCYPALESGQVTFVRHQPETNVVGQFFSPDNTISITESGSVFDPSEPDGTRVEYFSKETWKPEIIDCLLNDGTTVDAGIAPKEIRAFGITDETSAWRLGMRDRRQRRYLRRSWEVETELEGLNCELGERVSLSGRDVQHGALTSFVEPAGFGSPRITVDRPLSVVAGLDYWIALRNSEGKTASLMRAFIVDEYTLDLEFGLTWIPSTDGSTDPTLFKFGTYYQIHIPAIVKSIEPQGATVRLELGAYDSRIALDDNNDPPV